MDRLRGSLLVMVLLGVAIIVITTRTFLKYQPPIPETSLSLDDSPDAAPTNQASSTTLPGSSGDSLTSDRIKRLQDVIRNQRTALARLRAATRPGDVANVSKTRRVKRNGLLAKLTDLSLLAGKSDDGTKLTYAELTDRLADVRDFALELEKQLEAAETVVEMQSSEIEELQGEVTEARERATLLANAGEDLDSVVGKLLEESRELEGLARQTLIRIGPPAAAMLLAIEDQPPHVRRWVGGILAAIGADERPDSDRP